MKEAKQPKISKLTMCIKNMGLPILIVQQTSIITVSTQHCLDAGYCHLHHFQHYSVGNKNVTSYYE